MCITGEQPERMWSSPERRRWSGLYLLDRFGCLHPRALFFLDSAFDTSTGDPIRPDRKLCLQMAYGIFPKYCIRIGVSHLANSRRRAGPGAVKPETPIRQCCRAPNGLQRDKADIFNYNENILFVQARFGVAWKKRGIEQREGSINSGEGVDLRASRVPPGRIPRTGAHIFGTPARRRRVRPPNRE
jgi:hypothetical protein